MRAGAPEAGLNFIRDAQPAGRTHMCIGVLKVTIGKTHRTADALNRLCEKSRDLPRRAELDKIFHVVGVLPARLRVVLAMRSTKRVWHLCVLHSEATRHIEFP